MTSSYYRSVRHVVWTTLLFFGLSLGVSPDLRAEEPLAVLEAPRETAQEAPQEVEESANMGRFKTIAATSMGATGGMVGTYTAGLIACDLGGFGGDWGVLNCFDNPVVLTVAVAGGVIGGERGYSNNAFSIVFGGVSLGAFIAAAVSEIDPDMFLPALLLSPTSLGYLGYRLWRSRESDGERYALLPYRDRERTGVMLSGRF